MKIRSVHAYPMSSPIDPPQQRPFHGGVRRLIKRDVVLVVIETTDGYRGVAPAGASSSAMREFFEGETQGTFADVITGPVANSLEGRVFDEIAKAHPQIRALELPPTITTEAISAIDIALHDIAARQRDLPLYKLLAEEYGTEPTIELPLYASAGMYMEPEGYLRQAEAIERAGFFGYKYRPGIGPVGDRKTVELLTSNIDDAEIMLDVHTWWKLGEDYGDDIIRGLIEHAHNNGAYWIEEPVGPADHEAYVSLAEMGAPLAGGESEPTPDDLIALGKTGAVRFLQGDVRHHEGYTGCRAAVEYCSTRDNIEFVPHHFGTWLGLMANAHFAAAAPDTRLLEYPVFEDDPVIRVDPDPGMYPFDLAYDIIEGQPDVQDGRLHLPSGPGLGVEVNFDVIEQYPFVEGPWTEFIYEE